MLPTHYNSLNVEIISELPYSYVKSVARYVNLFYFRIICTLLLLSFNKMSQMMSSKWEGLLLPSDYASGLSCISGKLPLSVI